MKQVLVVIPVEDRHKEKLERAGEGCQLTYASPKTVTREMVQAADAIIGNVPAGLIGASEKLSFLQLNSAGTDAYVKPGVLSKQTLLTNATGAYSKAVAEHCLTMMLVLQKKLHLYRDTQFKADWADYGMVTSITDQTILVVGLGDIGLHFARLCKALGARKVIGVKRRMSECPEGVDALYLTEDLDALLPQADVLVSFLPGNDATKGIYSMERFQMMKPSAVFINGGRGNAVASDVLYEVLTKGIIASAGVDVTEIEPLPADSLLWQLPNLFITPHVSGGFHLAETFERIVDISCRNLNAWCRGEALENIVDFSTGYKL